VKKITEKQIYTSVIGILLIIISGGAYYYSDLYQKKISLELRVSELEDTLGITEENLSQKEEDLLAEKERVGSLAEEVQNIVGTVGILDKLSKTDKELLQKYSKVYFLNEHYVPSNLSSIPLVHLYNESVAQQIHSRVWPYLEDLILAAADDGVTLWINSAYRSFGTQSTLKARYTTVYGSGANTFSADQGYSEHQLGTTIDFTTKGIGGGVDGFEKTPAYTWLLENAYKYGFALSYPEGNAYYVFEPWHWRFVGQELATYLHKTNKNFYDEDQRKINEYLVKIFD